MILMVESYDNMDAALLSGFVNFTRCNMTSLLDGLISEDDGRTSKVM